MTINVAKVSPSIHEGTIAKYMKQDDDDDVIAQLHDA